MRALKIGPPPREEEEEEEERKTFFKPLVKTSGKEGAVVI